MSAFKIETFYNIEYLYNNDSSSKQFFAIFIITKNVLIIVTWNCSVLHKGILLLYIHTQ